MVVGQRVALLALACWTSQQASGFTLPASPHWSPSHTKPFSNNVILFSSAPAVFDFVLQGDLDQVKSYVENGGDVTVTDDIGDSPLLLAVENHLTDIIEYLIKDCGADANGRGKNGETPLLVAAYYGYGTLAMSLVDKYNAELNLQNSKGETALMVAAFWGNTESVRYLLEAGADPNIANEKGELPGEVFEQQFVGRRQVISLGKRLTRQESHAVHAMLSVTLICFFNPPVGEEDQRIIRDQIADARQIWAEEGAGASK
ncbi:unnamed protein product [Chrysoparadoxa australica]